MKNVVTVVQGGAPTVVDLTKPGVEPVGAPPLKKAFPALSLSANLLVIFHLHFKRIIVKTEEFYFIFVCIFAEQFFESPFLTIFLTSIFDETQYCSKWHQTTRGKNLFVRFNITKAELKQ